MKKRVFALLMLATLPTLAGPAAARAQLGWTAYSVGEFDSEDVVLVLGGISLGPRRDGWAPVFGVQAYWLQYTAGAADVDVTSVTPSVGLSNSFGTGSFSARVGYNFSSREIEGATTPVDVGDGVVTSVSLDYWGTGNVYLQGLGSYNWGAENLWTRGRAMFRLFGFGDSGSIMGGGEVAYLSSDNYSSLQPGVVAGFNPGRGTTINVGVGRRLGDSDATYFRAELVLSGR